MGENASHPVRMYLSAVGAAHTMRGLQAPALSENAISAALRGAKNRESLDEEHNRAVMSVENMKEIKRRLLASKLKTDQRRISTISY